MTKQILKSRQKAALIIILSLGFAAIPITHIIGENLFEGTSFNQGPMILIGKMATFIFLAAICAIPAFIIALIVFMTTTIQLSKK